MDAEYGLTRSSINLRAGPSLKSPVIHALSPQERVQIVGEAGDMLQVAATRWRPPLGGYALRSAIVRSPAPSQLFPRVSIDPNMTIPSVPGSVPLAAFRQWLASSDESPWLPPSYAALIRSGQEPSVGASIRRAIADHQADWDAWGAEVRAEGRDGSCTLDEWIALMQGGRDMWSIRTERIFAEASEHAAALGWVVPLDVLHWTGHVRSNADEIKYKTWYEVEFTKLDRQFKGWYKASLLNEFVLPTPRTDLAVPDNRSKVFDLTRTRLRMPADPEIADARRAGRAAAQYIDVKRALGSGVLHHNLCGEFCVAALASSDVIPMLSLWLQKYKPARDILAKDRGTSLLDLQVMLDARGIKYEFFRAEGSVAPLTPDYLRGKLDTGRMAIMFTGVTPYGALRSHSRIRHWIIVEDIVRVGNSGWLRVYNPFPNREEVYRFDDVVDMPSRSAIGLWVEPSRAASSDTNATVAALTQLTSPPIPVGAAA